MIINVRSYAFMRRYTAHLDNAGELDVPEQSSVADVLRHLGVPPEVKKIVLVNGRAVPPDRVLEQGDLLVFYPLLEGG